MLYIAVDGTGVPMVAAETEGRPGKGPDGQAHTREVKLACLFTQTALDEDGHPVRDPGSSSYLATFDPAARFGQLVDAEARRRGAEHIRQLVVLGDGAVWIWNLADELFPAATQIVDLYHAREHVHDLATLATRLLRASHPDWLAERLGELDTGDIPALLAAGRAPEFIGSLARERDKALGYFEVNAHRMHYAHFRDLGMFVGSGAVEAGCKAVIGQRLKLSGMRWTVPGATGIATLRCQEASNRWEEIWQRPHNQTTAAASPPGKLILLPTNLARTPPCGPRRIRMVFDSRPGPSRLSAPLPATAATEICTLTSAISPASCPDHRCPSSPPPYPPCGVGPSTRFARRVVIEVPGRS